MRSYDQYCALAKALDIIGDRWTMLIARELLLGASRYSDLQSGLPGIPTNRWRHGCASSRRTASSLGTTRVATG
ncbi:MAG: winged helix-turn-helix transcriptional regulator [Acidimicrobiales bacterium]